MMRQKPMIHHLGDSCICWSLGDTISEKTSCRVLALYRMLKMDAGLADIGVTDVVPSYNSLAVYFDPVKSDASAIACVVRKAASRKVSLSSESSSSKAVIFPVRYDGEDLDRVAGHAGMGRDEVVERHSAGRYIVAMIGFIPHFPYLIGLDKRLSTPRLSSPRARVPAGSVAIGGDQTGVYPRESPGGWNIIGRTDPDRLSELSPGDRVIFERV
jgi:inhibitor of KinA